MNTKTLYCFGDSWGAGAELNFVQGEKNFTTLLGDKFSYNVKNFSIEGMSLGLITRELAQNAKDIHKDNIVLVVIPPDSRWYTEWKTLDYNVSAKFYYDKTDDWFRYHHQMFIFTICEILNKIGCQYLLMHNYGEFPLADTGYYFSNFHKSKFLSHQSLTTLLTEPESLNGKLGPVGVEVNQGSLIFYGPYFEGKQYHPNQRGHEKIAELVQSSIQF